MSRVVKGGAVGDEFVADDLMQIEVAGVKIVAVAAAEEAATRGGQSARSRGAVVMEHGSTSPVIVCS